MPPRLRRKQAMKTEKDVISENSEVKIEKKTRVKTRRKRASPNVNKKVDKLVESGHNADSESESKNRFWKYCNENRRERYIRG